MRLSNIVHWSLKPSMLQAQVAGLLLGIGFIVPALWWLGLISIVWMISVLHKPVSQWKLAGLFFLIWTTKAALSISWFWNTYPIDWQGNISDSLQISIIAAYWLSSAIWLGLGGVVFAFLAHFLLRRSYLPTAVKLLLTPVFWVLSEICGAIIFSICTAGPGSFIQSYFSFSMVGNLVGNTSLGMWLAQFGSVYGLTFFMVVIAVTLHTLITRVTLVQLGGICAGVYLGCMYINPAGTYISDQTNFVIAVDTKFDAQFLSTDGGIATKARIVAQAVDEALTLEPTVVILPEDSRYLPSQFDQEFPNQALSIFQFTHGNTDSVVIDSSRYVTKTGDTVLRANIFDGASKKMWQFDKQYLVPQGEYVPTLYGFIVRLLGFGAKLDSIAKTSAYRPGPFLQTALLPEYLPGVLFCFESVNPLGVSQMTNVRKVPFVAHPISHAWFNTPIALWRQLDVMLQMQARYSGVPIISAGNMATGKMYLPTGEIITGTIVGGGERYVLREFKF